MDNPKPISQTLPYEARMALVRAAKTPINHDPLARVKAIEHATDKIKESMREYFRVTA